ncbi:MAG: methyltransferase [Dehalococcoidia bacterium]|nr:methyltransferase [Dehalococcoidia bacterium]MYA52346.1 methyltransferase [Dehalococcoidia bacterium]
MPAREWEPMAVLSDELEAARLRIYALQDGAIRAQTLAFCLRSGLFERLAAGPGTSEELGLAPRVAPTLLAFLASQGLAEQDEQGRFRATPATEQFLVRSSPRFAGGRALLFQGFHEQIGRLGEALASGEPLGDAGQADMFGSFDVDDQRWFAEGMLANAIAGAERLRCDVDFSGFRRLLDVGGSSGGYSLALLEAHPALEATIFDLPAVRPLAEERIAQRELGARCRFVAGSFFDDRLPAGHDVVLLANILHDWETQECRRILARCHEAVEPGGTIVVVEPMLAEDLSGPDHASVSGLTMALLGGENRTQSRIGELLEEAGFEGAWRSPLGEQNSVVTARKPGGRS